MGTLAQRLKSAMGDAVKPADLARHCRVKPSSVSDWLSGETKSLKSEPLVRAAALLQVNALWLATGEGQKQPGVASPAKPGHGQTPALVVRETVHAPDWPFTYITAERWAHLPLHDRLRIETFADATLQSWEARQAGNGRRA